ncbi:hypothetical protein BKA66DRAFT_149279 [Pyrenochaeta sp. MPI-SDFR-AT-0127]|nr:hypothetical protein BKA66DRAFT_149279 [Pyrenochaeta sp. MPI-SDFR-AT-0127]
MDMASLQSLPNELLDNIFANIDSRDARNVSLTCKRLRAVATPAVYHSISLEWRNAIRRGATAPKAPHIHSLLRTLIKNPDYVKLIKSLEFRATNVWYYQDDGSPLLCIPLGDWKMEEVDATIVLFEELVDKLQIPESACWKSYIRQKTRPAYLQMLVVQLCTHLESLSVSVEFEMETGCMEMALKQALATTPLAMDPTSWCSKLSHVRMTGDAKGDIWTDPFFNLKKLFMLLFYLPNLETLELTTFVQPVEDVGAEWESIMPPEWPLMQAPNAEKLTTLRLVRSSISPAVISLMLQQTPNLTTFEYDTFNGFSVPLDLSAIRDALLHVCDSLAHLSIRYDMHQEDENYPPQDVIGVTFGSIGPLRDFPALTTLSASLGVLFGSDDVRHGQTPKLADFLPPGLQCLTITDDMWMYNDFQQYFEDVDAMSILRTYLTGETAGYRWRGASGYQHGGDNWNGGLGYSNIIWTVSHEPGWKGATPGLKKFVYDLRTRGHLTFAYWNHPRPREELERVCKWQGIECEVLFEDED